MSTFEWNYHDIISQEPQLPDWVKAERYEYCDSFFNGELTAVPSKGKNALRRLFMSVASTIK